MRTIRLSSSFPPLPPQPPRPPSPPPPEGSPLDKDVIIVLGAVLCVLICAVWVHSIVRCMLRRNRQGALMAAATAAAVQAAEQMDASFVGLDPKTIAALPVISGPNPSASAEPGIPPASVAAIISNTECIICLQEFAQSEPIKLLPNCGHGFHVECIGAWLRSHSSCPICRHAVLEPPSPLGGASSSRGSVDVSSSSMLLASPLMQHYQQQLSYQQNQQFRQQQAYFQQQIGSGSSSLYTMFAADGDRAASILRVLHLSENPAAAATTAAATAGQA